MYILATTRAKRTRPARAPAARKAAPRGAGPGRARKAPASAGKQRPAGSGRRWLRALAVLLLVAAALVGGVLLGTAPSGAHAWQPLGAGRGSIRWVETATEPAVRPPMAPEWVRRLRRRRIPWPTDLPVEPPAASFGAAGDSAAAWFLVRSARPQKDLWHVDKASVRLTDPAGRPVPWEGGSGTARVDSDGRTQLLYLRLPLGLAKQRGVQLGFRLARGGERTRPLRFRLDDR